MPALLESRKHKTTYVTLSKDEYESMKSTIEVLDDEELMEQIKESKDAIKEGKVWKWDDILKERRLI